MTEDLALVTSDLAGDVEWSVGDDPSSSDHLPIAINITGAVVRERNAPHETFNYNKADWFSFRAELGLCQSVIMDPFPQKP